MKESVNLSNFKGCIVDIDDTLYNYKKAHKKALITVYNDLFISVCKIDWCDFEREYKNQRSFITEKFARNGSSRSRFLAFQSMFEKLNLQHAYSLAFDAENLYWECLIESIEPISAIVDLIKNVADQGLMICALTDMQARIQVMKLRALGLENCIDFLVTSEEVGVEKPDKRTFIVALGKMNLRASDVFMIGDNIEKDIVGARNLGIDAWLVKDDVLRYVR